MKITIHRGTHEIGGSCVEIQVEKTRIIADIGMPLVQPGDKTQKLDSLPLARQTAPELRESGVLPPVAGLYADDPAGPEITAVLLSHPHQDHYGLIRHIHPSIPVYLSDGARRMIAASDIFLPLKAQIKNPVVIDDLKPFSIGSIRVTPYLADHSGFGAMSFLIEGGGKKVFYTGDIRGHGRKGKLFERLLRQPPEGVDCLLMEGTTLGSNGHAAETEEAVQKKIAGLARKWAGLKLVYASAQNIDRIVSFYKAAREIKGIFAIDLYTAYILDSLETPSLPRPSPRWRGLRVFYSHYLMKKLLREGMGDLLRKYRPFEISPEEIRSAPGRVLLMYRDSLERDVEKIGNFDGSVLIYSQYQGYRREASFAKVESFLTENGIALESAHTSGHAPRKDLERLIRAVAPKVLTPIHTFSPGSYYELWHTVRPLEDGETFDLKS